MPDLRCRAHNLRMEKISKSLRGIPEYYCARGCKKELGEARVRKVFPNRGFGFLALPDSEDGDLFFHFSQLDGIGQVEAGDIVKFEVGVNPLKKKMQAVNIRKVETKSEWR